jgi:hypothetical protein
MAFCHEGVVCPALQKCVEPEGCVSICFDVVCEGGLECNPNNGQCEDLGCVDMTCFPPMVCEYGECVEGPGGAGGAGAAGGAPTGGSGGGAANGSGLTSGGPDASPDEEGDCGCRVVGARPRLPFASIGLLVGLLGAGWARRARRSRPRR